MQRSKCEDQGHLPEAVVGSDAACLDGLHSLELAVQRQLLSIPDVRFPRLVVRRLPDGVLLEGVVEVADQGPDVDSSLRAIKGVEKVINHLVTCRLGEPPRKG